MYIYKIYFYSAIRKNEIMLASGKWMELENFMSNKLREAPKVRSHMFSLICGARPVNVCIYAYIYI
jgi:hypothetical protein